MQQKDLILKKDFAEIKDVGNENQENCIRLYCDMYPKGFTLQIRTYKPINKFGNGKSRPMVASVGVTTAELRQMLEYAENEAKEKEGVQQD